MLLWEVQVNEGSMARGGDSIRNLQHSHFLLSVVSPKIGALQDSLRRHTTSLEAHALHAIAQDPADPHSAGILKETLHKPRGDSNASSKVDLELSTSWTAVCPRD